MSIEELPSTEILVVPPSCSAGNNPGAQLYTAWARVGTNSTSGTWEYSVGTGASTILATGQYGWAAATAPFDTGAVAFDLQVDPTGTGSQCALAVANGAPITGAGNAFNQITAVVIRAEIARMATNPTLALRAEWQALNIDFFSSSDTAYNYPGQAAQQCPLPVVAVTPAAAGAISVVESRVILPGTVSGATYPYRMTLNGTIQMSSSANSTALSTNQLGIRVWIYGN
jgi:hypothetical protein